MKFSTVPLLFLVLVSFMASIAYGAKKQYMINRSEVTAIYCLLVVLVVWGILNGLLASFGIYSSPQFLSLLPGLWLPLIPILIGVVSVLLFSTLKFGLSKVFENTPRQYFIYVQALRILAIGSVFKAINGVFPTHFAYLVVITDFLFGISALYVGYMALRSSLSEKYLMIWNLVGALVVGVPALMFFQTGLPGPIQLFKAYPTTEKLLEFPMVLAPSLVVPTFILLNILVVWRLMARKSS